MKLKELCKIRHGFAFKGKDIIKDHTTKYVLVTPGNFNIGGGFKKDKCKYFSENGDIPKDYILKENDLIVTMTDLSVKSDTLGYSALIPKDDNSIYLHNQRIGLVHDIDESKVLKDYLYWFMRTKKYQQEVVASQSGTAIHHTSPDRILNIEIDLPSIDDQRKIVKILFDIENKIKNNNEINNNLYEIGDNLYNEYFGKHKDNLTFDYKIVKLNEVADNYDSKRKPLSSREREQHRGIYPYYGATSIIDYVDNYIFDDTYLLMGEDGTVKTDDGYPVLQYIWGKNWINNHAHVLKGKNISTELLMFALRKINIENIITGAVQPKINQENMNKIEIVIGSDSKNKELEIILKNLMDKSKNIIEENKKLKQLRDTLLPKLINGEIDLDNIEI